jgi:hypothetical protein
MRSRIPVLLALAACCVIATAIYLQSGRPNSDIQPPEAALNGAGASADLSEESTAVAGDSRPRQPIAAPEPRSQAEAAPASPDRTHQAYVAGRISLLQQLSMDDQSSSLQTILGELTNRDPEIRKAAREATVQFASRDAIPQLLEAAAQTEDPAEKQELIEAAEFLKLPSLTEVMQQRGIKPVLTAKPAPGKQLPAFDRKPKQAVR